MLTCSCFANNTHTPVIIAKQTLTSSAPDLDTVSVMPAGSLQPQSDSYIYPLSDSHLDPFPITAVTAGEPALDRFCLA